jgi:hypothetical protein
MADLADFRSAALVNGLIAVPHDREVDRRACEQLDEALVRRVDALVIVDDEVQESTVGTDSNVVRQVLDHLGVRFSPLPRVPPRDPRLLNSGWN